MQNRFITPAFLFTRPLLGSGAFASQLEEVDRLLRAFMVQRQQARYFVPTDEASDERLMDSDEESGRRWSSSTGSTSVAVAPAHGLVRQCHSVFAVEEMHGLPTAHAASHVDLGVQRTASSSSSSTSTSTSENATNYTTPSPKNTDLCDELQLVGSADHGDRRPNAHIFRLEHPEPDKDSGDLQGLLEERSDNLRHSGNNQESHNIPGLKTTPGTLERRPVREGGFTSTMDCEGESYDVV